MIISKQSNLKQDKHWPTVLTIFAEGLQAPAEVSVDHGVFEDHLVIGVQNHLGDAM